MVEKFPIDNPNSGVGNDSQAIANLLETIKGYQKDLAELESKKQEIRKRLRSLSLRWLESIGIKRDNLKDLNQINAVDIRLLSSDDLRRKLKSYENSQKSIRGLINDLHSQIETIKEETKSKVSAEARIEQDKLKQFYIDQYKNRPAAFFASVATNEKSNVNTDMKALYKNADQIIATCELFDSNIDHHHLWLAWQVVDRVRNMEQHLSPQHKFYTDGAAKLLNILCNIDNRFGNVAGIEILFNAKKYEQVNSYLRQLLLENVSTDPKRHEQMLAHLKDDVSVLEDQRRSRKKLPRTRSR